MPLFTTDFDGVSRPQGSSWDIGAYEFVGGGTPDTTDPSGSITAPANGSTVSGSVIITCSATDNIGVANVQFYLDGVTLGVPVTATTSNYSILWNTFASSNASHTIYSIITDLSGNTFTTSSISVTVNNVYTTPPPEVNDPPTAPPPPTTVPQVVISEAIPLGVIFYNTLGEFSTFNAEAVFPSSIDPNIDNAFTEDWINVVRDSGVVGDGSDETSKVQAALDQAASGGTKTKVLIPGGLTVTVAPVENDLCAGSALGIMGVCLWLDSGVTLRVDGTIRVDPQAAQIYSADHITVLETRNSFVGTSSTRDNSIVIEGNGIIDLEGIYSGVTFTENEATTKQLKNIVALRAYKTDKLTVKGITITHGITHKLICGFCTNLEILDMKFKDALKYESDAAPVVLDTSLITLDVCNKVRVSGCQSINCGAFYGITDWASKEILVINNIFTDLMSGNGSETFHAKGTGFWFTDTGMEFGSLDSDQLTAIYALSDGLDARTTISDNIFCRNGLHGIQINGAALQGELTKGFFIRGNKCCSNANTGIYYDGLEDYLFSDNQIENNGWGLPLLFD